MIIDTQRPTTDDSRFKINNHVIILLESTQWSRGQYALPGYTTSSNTWRHLSKLRIFAYVILGMKSFHMNFLWACGKYALSENTTGSPTKKINLKYLKTRENKRVTLILVSGLPQVTG